MHSDKVLPRARTTDLELQDADGEVLVYDKKCHQAHCLNRLAALVWQHCDGHTTQADMARLLHEQLRVPADQHLVEIALQDLHEAGLLRGPITQKPRDSRRELAGRLGASVSAFLLAPMICSVMTRTAQAQSSQPTTTTVIE